jgi:isochorismate hydrolase
VSALRDFEDYAWRDVAPAELLAIYAPYRRNRAIPPRSALLILHPVAGMALPVQPEWTEAAARLLAHARAASMPILHSVPQGSASAAEPREGEKLLLRPCDSAFLFSELPAVLGRGGVGGLILCGATTSGALRATAVEAKSYGYRVAIAEEATADEAGLLHKMALFDIAHKYGDVMSLDEMLAMMAGQ